MAFSDKPSSIKIIKIKKSSFLQILRDVAGRPFSRNIFLKFIHMYEYIYSSDVLPTPTAVNTAEEGIAVPVIVRAGCGSSMNSPSLVLSSQFSCVGDAHFEDKLGIYRSL